MNALNLAIAKKVKAYVEEHKKFPNSITIDGVKYNYGTFTEILASTVVNINSVYAKKSYKVNIGNYTFYELLSNL